MIDFIIPVRDRDIPRIKNCINSIKSKYVGKIIVVDYGSSEPVDIDGVEVIKVSRDMYPVWNKSHALNIGIRASSAKYIATIDCDIILPKDFINKAHKTLGENKFVLSNKVRRITRFTTFGEALANSTDWIPGQPNYQKAVGGIQLFPRTWACRYRGYNEELTNWGGIDTYMHDLAVASGLEVVFIDEVILHQEHALKKEDNLPPNEAYNARVDRMKRKSKVPILVQEAIKLERWGVFDSTYINGNQKISCAVMAHPKRREQANALYSKLSKCPFIDCQIVWDTKNDRWHTGERCLSAGVKAGSDWHLVIQDDAIIPDEFYKHVSNAVRYVPTTSLISLYTGKVRPFPRRVSDAVGKATYCSWLKSDLLYWGVAIVVPTKHIEAMLEYAKTREEAYDTRIGIFYLQNMLPVFYTMPSLVDHNEDLGSLLSHGHGPGKRVAHNFIKSEPVWNKDVVDI